MVIELGYINACIAGDHRYSSKLTVTLDTETKKATVVLSENGAIGGMDGPGGSTPFRETKKVTVDADPTQVVKAIKSVMDNTIKRYGKPTKNFCWTGVGNGLSASLARRAIEQALQDDV